MTENVEKIATWILTFIINFFLLLGCNLPDRQLAMFLHNQIAFCTIACYDCADSESIKRCEMSFGGSLWERL